MTEFSVTAPAARLLSLPDAYGAPLADFDHYPTLDLLHVGWHGHLTAEAVVRGAKAGMQLFATGTNTLLLRNGAAAAAFLAEAPGRFAAVGDRDLAAFQAEAQRLGLTVREEGMVEGYNYTRGRHLVLRLFRS